MDEWANGRTGEVRCEGRIELGAEDAVVGLERGEDVQMCRGKGVLDLDAAA